MKIKVSILLFLFSILSLQGFSQEEILNTLKDKYGEIKKIEKLNYTSIYAFTTKDDKVGLIDGTNTIIYEPYFDTVFSYKTYRETYIKAIMPNGRMALLTIEGRVLIQPVYEDLFVTSSDLILTKQDNKYGIINFNGIGYLYPEFDTIKVKIDEDTFFVASMKEKNMVFNTNSDIVEYFDNDTIISFVEVNNASLFPFRFIAKLDCDIVKYIGGGNFYIREGEKTELVNRKGEKPEGRKMPQIDKNNIINFDWQRIIFKKDSLVGLMDYNGMIILEPIYKDINILIQDDVYSFNLNGYWGLINQQGKIIVRPQFESFSTFIFEGIQYIKGVRGGRTALLDKRGRVIIHAAYDDVEPMDVSPYFNITQNGGKGIISRIGVVYLQPQYDEVKVISQRDTLFLARRNNRYSLFNDKGKEIYDGLNAIVDIYDSTIVFIEKGKLKQYPINASGISFSKGREIKTPYKEFSLSFDSIIIVKDSKGWLYASRKTFKPINDKHFDYITPMVKGYGFVVEGKKLNIVDEKFNTIFNVIESGAVKAELENISNLLYNAYKNGKSYQIISLNNKYGILGLKAIKEIKFINK
ncbi:MAG: WG repeat-containing protein [Bacteroidales bacterium]|jgi:hypothetical protein|nr:WG repeat-containing protein [Bacteroidales bacterium]